VYGFATPEWEEGIEQLQGGAHGPAGGKGAKVAAAVPDAPAGDHHPGPLFLDGDLDQGIVLIVPENNIVTGPVLLDQRGLKDQGLFFGGGENGLDPPEMAEHDRCFGMGRASVMGVLGQSFTQIPGLAHVENLAPTQHLIDPGLVTDGGQKGGAENGVAGGCFFLLMHVSGHLLLFSKYAQREQMSSEPGYGVLFAAKTNHF